MVPEIKTISWAFPEYETHHRMAGWFIGSGLIGLGFFIYAIATASFLFACIIVFLAGIYWLQHSRHPLTVEFNITPDGIELQERHFPWKELKSFWIIYEPPEVKKLYFEFKGFRPHLSIPLHDQNPLIIRETLLPYLDENLEKEEEPLTDVMGRMFKL